MLRRKKLHEEGLYPEWKQKSKLEPTNGNGDWVVRKTIEISAQRSSTDPTASGNLTANQLSGGATG